ncbi:MAG: hypothetical protein WC485_09110, partial [Opitutaceae bacterium]
MKQTVLATAVTAGAGVATAAAPKVRNALDEARVQVCLNGDWLRHVGGECDTVPADGWEIVRVPEYALSAAKGSAWFRLDFLVPAGFAAGDRRVRLRFVRVRHHAIVLLNGERCGENYVPARH